MAANLSLEETKRVLRISSDSDVVDERYPRYAKNARGLDDLLTNMFKSARDDGLIWPNNGYPADTFWQNYSALKIIDKFLTERDQTFDVNAMNLFLDKQYTSPGFLGMSDRQYTQRHVVDSNFEPLYACLIFALEKNSDELFNLVLEVIKLETLEWQDRAPGCIYLLRALIGWETESDVLYPIISDDRLSPSMKKGICEIYGIPGSLAACRRDEGGPVVDRLKEALKTWMSDDPQLPISEHEAFVAYGNLTSRYADAGFMEQAKELLLNYTKHDSSLMRFFTGCWNRHHLDEVSEIVDAIDKGKIIDKTELMLALKAINGINPQGALARRIAFIDRLPEAAVASLQHHP